MNRASVFELHKRFKEGRESVRDDERFGRIKEVKTPELICQIKNFMDKDRRVSIETISAQFDVSVYTLLFARNWRCGRTAQRVLREDQKERRCHDNGEMVELIKSDPAVLDTLVTCDDSWIYCYDPDTNRQRSQWNHAGSPRPKKARHSKSNHKLLMIPFFWQHWHCLHALRSQWTDNQQVLCWGFTEVQKEIPSEEASTLQIGLVAFPSGQCTSSQLHPCQRLFDQDGHQDSSSPSLSSIPCSLWHLVSSRKNLEAVVMRQLRRWKRLWRRSLTRSQKLLKWYNKCIAAGLDYFEGD